MLAKWSWKCKERETDLKIWDITENPKWIIWFIWAIVCHYTDKKIHFHTFLSHFVRVLTHYGSNESNDSLGFFCSFLCMKEKKTMVTPNKSSWTILISAFGTKERRFFIQSQLPLRLNHRLVFCKLPDCDFHVISHAY